MAKVFQILDKNNIKLTEFFLKTSSNQSA